jgi:hypothetical protein
MKKTVEDYEKGLVTVDELAISNIDEFLESHQIRLDSINYLRNEGRDLYYEIEVSMGVQGTDKFCKDWDYDFENVYNSAEFRAAYERYIHLYFKNVQEFNHDQCPEIINFVIKKTLSEEEGYTDELVEVLSKCWDDDYVDVFEDEPMNEGCDLYGHRMYGLLFEYIEKKRRKSEEFENYDICDDVSGFNYPAEYFASMMSEKFCEWEPYYKGSEEHHYTQSFVYHYGDPVKSMFDDLDYDLHYKI